MTDSKCSKGETGWLVGKEPWPG